MSHLLHSHTHSQVSAWCSKAQPRCWLVFKRSYWLCGCLLWFLWLSLSWIEEDRKEENYSNICIYVPLWSNTQNQLQDCILDSLSHFKTDALDCDIIRFRPSVNQKFWQVQKELQYLLFYLNKESADMDTEEFYLYQITANLIVFPRFIDIREEIFSLKIYSLKQRNIIP